jgi:hypothetical protein
MSDKTKPLESELELVLAMHAAELSRLRGFSLKTVRKSITLMLVAASDTIPCWTEAMPQERREAVVNVVNRYVDIPIIGESIEAMAIGFCYDLISQRLKI